jgi:hypothetical protein
MDVTCERENVELTEECRSLNKPTASPSLSLSLNLSLSLCRRGAVILNRYTDTPLVSINVKYEYSETYDVTECYFRHQLRLWIAMPTV